MKTSVKKICLFVLAFAILAMSTVMFSTVGISALASDPVEISGTIRYVGVETVTYNATSQPLKTKFTATFVSTDATTYTLTEGVDFNFKEGSVWKFQAVTEESAVELDVESNNFKFSGKYSREVEVVDGTVYKPKEGETTTLEYTIAVCDPILIVANSYRAVVGMKLEQVAFALGWNIETLPEGYTKTGILTTAATVPGVVLSFTAPVGTENNFKLDPEVGNKTVNIEIREKPEIIYKGSDGTQITMQENLITYNAETNKYSGTIVKNSFTKQGYTFKSFKIEGDESETEYSNEANDEEELILKVFDLDPVAKVIFVSQWNPRNDTKYKVEHHRQGLTDENSYQKRTNDTQTLEGTTEETIIIDIENVDEKHVWVMEGFTYSPQVTEEKGVYTGEVKANGSLVLKLYYTRDLYEVKYVVDDELVTGEAPVDGNEYKYEERFSLKKAEDLVKPGYTFSGWTDGQSKTGKDLTVFATSLKYTMIAPKEENGDKKDTVTFTAKFTPKTNTPYTVNHILVNEDGTLTTLLVKELYGETDSTAVAMAAMTGYKKISGYADDNDLAEKETGIITADGNLVLAVYYELVEYEVTFVLGQTSLLDPQSYNINGVLTLPAGPNKEGYTFNGWRINGVIYQPGKEIQILGGIRVEGVYSANITEGSTADNSNNNVVTLDRPSKPLSGGAIAGIVISGVVVLSLAVFSIIWFAVKKKTFKDIGKLFQGKNIKKKEASQTSVLNIKNKK